MNYIPKNIDIKSIAGNKVFLFSILAIFAGIGVSIQNLAFYLHFDFNLVLSLMLTPFVLFVKHKGSYSLRFGIVSLCFLCFYPFLKVQSFYFFGFAFFLLFTIENNFGRFNNLPVFLLALLSPVAIFAIEVFGFPIRLWLTEASTQIISFVNTDINSLGNQIFIDEDKFTVDPECMGLKMVVTGFLITLLIIAWFEKKKKQEISIIQLIFILSLATILIIISNLFRIIGIIFAKAAPETALHEMIGIFSLIIYVILPVYIICKLSYRYFSKEIQLKPAKAKKPIGNILVVVLIVFLGFLNYNRENYRNIPTHKNPEPVKLESFGCILLENGVTQLTNDSALVYFKPIPNFYSADHTPMICWKGSGYLLQNQRKIIVEAKEIYYAELVKGTTETLYTAWWYSNVNHQTISQLDWRWRLIKGEGNFSLVNITCEDSAKLIKEVRNLY